MKARGIPVPPEIDIVDKKVGSTNLVQEVEALVGLVAPSPDVGE